MKEFIKEIFSLENLKKGMMRELSFQADMAKSEYLKLRSMIDINNTSNEEIKIKKAA
jgi:hypothetical protein